MRITTLIAASIALAACATPYWDPKSYWTRPDATLPVLAAESEACYRAALDPEMPAAFPRAAADPTLTHRTPPPRIWERVPRDVTFERFDEQLRYERCMRVRGWQARRVTTPTL